MRDIVKLMRQEETPCRLPDISGVMKSCSDRYRKIRADLEILDSECHCIVQHIKSYPDWEYFIDAFRDYNDKKHPVLYSKFNSVRIVGNKVSLLYEPLHCRWDNNNYEFGTCTMDDIMNIESIIRDRKIRVE